MQFALKKTIFNSHEDVLAASSLRSGWKVSSHTYNTHNCLCSIEEVRQPDSTGPVREELAHPTLLDPSDFVWNENCTFVNCVSTHKIYLENMKHLSVQMMILFT